MLIRLACTLIEDLIRGLSGPLGVRLRRAWYGRRLKACGRGLVIGPGVFISGAEYISLGDNVWIDRHAVLIAGPPRADARIERVPCPQEHPGEGEIAVGCNSHLGIGTIVQGHGGVSIGPCFTSSAGVKIYSFSNDYRTCRSGTMTGTGRAERCSPGYRLSPVVIGRNVWLGLNVAMIGHSVGDDCFVFPGSVVSADIPPNSVAAGAPARRIRARFGEVEP